MILQPQEQRTIKTFKSYYIQYDQWYRNQDTDSGALLHL
jgi:hypothetical protein